ncbi:MAG: hypothetical protein J5902_07085 [Paludibacteraceae bacterium]|nr:hypothetical protein [Paludibacteraceae bacterium]
MDESSESQPVTSYEADGITLSTDATNFVGWFEGDNTTAKSAAKSYSYKATATTTIRAIFKRLSFGEATGDLSPYVAAIGSNNYTITIPTTAYGTWTASDFAVTFTENGSRGDISKGTVTYATTSGSVLGSTGTLTIPFTYNPTSWGNTEVYVTVTPASGGVYGDPIVFTIRASAVEPVTEEAQIWENGVKTDNGTLAEMIAKANTLSSNPTVKLMQDKTIDAPLSLHKSMKFDLNDKTITSTAASAFSIDAAGIDVQIVDEGFSQIGKIATECASSGIVSVVTFTQKAKLSMQGGTLSAANTGAGAAYGIDVRQGSVYYMTGGNLTVSATADARGVNVASADDYATFNGGTVTVSAGTNAYGLWSAGQSNITNATVDVKTTTGQTGYGFYINGGVTTLTEVTTVVSVKTAGAGGAFVKAGRLNVNGGSFAVSAVTSEVYGVYVAAGATAVVQQNTTITAEATGASGQKVYGVNNIGDITLSNISLTATSPTTDAVAVKIAADATSTTINGGSFTVRSNSGALYALHHQGGTLEVDGASLRAIGGGSQIYAVRSTLDATIANATLYAETQESGSIAYGFVGATAGKTIKLTNCTITGKSATSKAYAIYSRANTTAVNCTLTATTGTEDAYGVYAENGTNSIVNTNATVTANTIKAYGVYHAAGALSISGGLYDVTAEQSTAAAAQNTVLYGIYGSAAGITTTVQDAEFNVTASNNAYSQAVYGVYTKGTISSTNSTYTVKGRATIRGIQGDSNVLLNGGNTINAQSTNGGACYGVYAPKSFTIENDIVSAKATTTDVYALFFAASTSVGNVLNGKFSAVGNNTNGYGGLNAAGTVGKVVLKGGVYTTAVNLKKYAYAGCGVYTLDNTHPDYAAGYRYTIATETPGKYVCYIVGGNKYETLEAALQYTKDNSANYTIVMSQNYTLPAGDYTLPSNATLLVPYKNEQTSIAGAQPIRRYIVGLIEENMCLTLAENAHLNVDGQIEVGGEMYCRDAGRTAYNNSPFGRIHMKESSMIQLNSGAKLYVWGFITGSGEIIAKNGSEVHEMFQIGDMKSMTSLAKNYQNNDFDFFPINQYYIQNIEVPTTYYYGSNLITAMCVYYSGSYYGDNSVKLIGTSDAMFLVTGTDESSWVRKSYDASRDYQIYDVNSQAQLGSVTINLGGVPVLGTVSFSSTSYILPITSNLKVHVHDGDFAITQTTQFLPGSIVEINKTASLTINSGKSVYIFDADQWPLTATTAPAFSPSWVNAKAPTRSKVDAAINVHGNINVVGKLYTSRTLEGATNATYSANIYSNNADAGTIAYTTAAGTSQSTITLMTSADATKDVTMDPAQLKNGDGSYASTSGTASGESWVYMNDEWVKTYTNGCFEVIGSTVYAKPSEYVALKKTQTVSGKLKGVEETNHTYLTVDDKLLILMDDCQWWEVEATADPTVFECKKEGYEGFYYYNTSSSKWELKTVTVTFYSAETGSTVLKNMTVGYNAIPDQAVIATNPTKATTAAATYTFYGWKSSATGTTYKWTDQLEKATADMSYRPVFTENPRHYTITLNDADNGAAVKLEVAYGTTPSYEPKKDATAQYTYTFNKWNPALANVTGTATYTALWNSTVNHYNITWKNGDDVLETDENQAYGTATAYNGATPTKATDDDYVYTFSKWKSSLTGSLYTDGSTPAVGGETTYEAQFSTTPRYAVSFVNYNGIQLASTVYTQGETPAYDGDVPTRTRDYDGYFRFDGWKNSAGTKYNVGAALPAVSQKEIYTAQYVYVTDLFTVTLNNVDGVGGSWSGKFGAGATPFYNKNNDDVPVTPTKTSTDGQDYVFTGWSPELAPVSGPATYTASFVIDNSEFGEPLDIVDATDNTTETSLTINTNTNIFASSGWPYTINGTSYAKTDREADRTLVFTHDYDADDSRLITVKDKNGITVSRHTYTIPLVYDDALGNPELSVQNDNRIIYVRENTILRVSGNASAAAIYVAPTAELIINNGATLTVGKLVLRTSPSSSAILTNEGTLNATQTYYSRITRDQEFHLFAIPLASNTADVVLSDGSSCAVASTVMPYGNAWVMREYNAQRRADNGSTGENWDNIGWTGSAYADAPVTASKAYEMRAGSKYYREYRFPVTLPTTATSVPVTYATGSAGSLHAGWNILCSPYTHTYTINATDPATGIKVCWQQGDEWIEEQPSEIKPARPFAYQADAAGTLDFTTSTFTLRAPRHQSEMEAQTETEWLQLDLTDGNGLTDQTSLYVHPSRFTAGYEAGIDLAKQSLASTRPILYTTHAYGNMAFAGVSDEALEQGIALTFNSPAAQTLTLSLRDNEWLNRMVYVWLLDNETGEHTDLLMDDYRFAAPAGTTAGRLVLQGRFYAPQVATGLDETGADYRIYNLNGNIAVSGVEAGTAVYVFDAVGHMLYHGTAEAEDILIPAPSAGVYMLHIGGKTAKMVINK